VARPFAGFADIGATGGTRASLSQV
jgi:hypothetical protein